MNSTDRPYGPLRMPLILAKSGLPNIWNTKSRFFSPLSEPWQNEHIGCGCLQVGAQRVQVAVQCTLTLGPNYPLRTYHIGTSSLPDSKYKPQKQELLRGLWVNPKPIPSSAFRSVRTGPTTLVKGSSSAQMVAQGEKVRDRQPLDGQGKGLIYRGLNN